MELSLGDALQILAFAAGALMALWAGGRWTGRLEKSIENVTTVAREGFKDNTEVHEKIIDKVDKLGERVSVVETKCDERHREGR